MKIALLGTRGIPPCYGGTETYVDYLSRYLAATGDEVVVYCRRLPQKERQKALRAYPSAIKRIEIPSIESKHLDNLIRSLLSAIHVAFDPDVDLVQINNPGPCLFSFIPRMMGKKVVGAMRALDAQREKWDRLSSILLKSGELFSLKFAHVTTVNSLAMQAYFFETYHARTVYIPNGVQLPQILPEPDLITKQGLSKKAYLLFMARLEPEKQCHTLIRAFNKIKDMPEAKGFKLAIAGHRGLSEGYYQQLRTMADDDRIKFLGFASGKLKEELLANAYGFILPSSVEGMSNSLLSAMAYGIPSIVSDIPENAAVINGAETDPRLNDFPGMLFGLADADDLAEKILCLLADPEKAQLRGTLLRKHVAYNFELETMGKKTKNVYKKLLSKKNKRLA